MVEMETPMASAHSLCVLRAALRRTSCRYISRFSSSLRGSRPSGVPTLLSIRAASMRRSARLPPPSVGEDGASPSSNAPCWYEEGRRDDCLVLSSSSSSSRARCLGLLVGILCFLRVRLDHFIQVKQEKGQWCDFHGSGCRAPLSVCLSIQMGGSFGERPMVACLSQECTVYLTVERGKKERDTLLQEGHTAYGSAEH